MCQAKRMKDRVNPKIREFIWGMSLFYFWPWKRYRELDAFIRSFPTIPFLEDINENKGYLEQKVIDCNYFFFSIVLFDL